MFNNCAILDDYHIEKEPIGVGGFGTVHLGTQRATNKTFAVKYMDVSAICKLTATLALSCKKFSKLAVPP